MNLSLKINQEIADVLRAVKSVCNELGIAWIVVGATARDLVLHHGYGAAVRRATHDIDFAVEVADWESFQRIKEQLLAQGYKESKTQHRLFGPNKESIDLVPFGRIENDDSTIEWPPKGEVAMNVLGFSEACRHADQVTIEGGEEFTVPVATPVGMTLLKLIAWTDRTPELRRKDATDLKYVFENYERIPSVQDEAYDVKNSGVMERYEWDLTLASIHLLGRHVRQIATKRTYELVEALIAGSVKQRAPYTLIAEMGQNYLAGDRNDQMFQAFVNGFQEA